MANIADAKRLIKRAILANITTTKKDLAITPLISGKHGIGKSMMIKSIADDLGGICITVEGGTLKEGEITGIPYQYKDESGNIAFRFLPYYAVERIQNEEKRLFLLNHHDVPEGDPLLGNQNRYADNKLTPQEKIDALLQHRVKPVIIFIDEINRTENVVYRELMNILLTHSVNGYEFPWWVFFVGAMNPSTQNSLYSTNEMDPAQLDRFLKLTVVESVAAWEAYAKETGVSEDIIRFLKSNPQCLSPSSKGLEDEEKPMPSPRGWDMVDIILKSEPMLRGFFTDRENSATIVEKDQKALMSAKLGSAVATMYLTAFSSGRAMTVDEFMKDDEKLSSLKPLLDKMSPAKKVQSCDVLVDYLQGAIDFISHSKPEMNLLIGKLRTFIAYLDSSTQLLFAQKCTSATSDSSGTPLIQLLYPAFEAEVFNKLNLSESIKEAIRSSKK